MVLNWTVRARRCGRSPFNSERRPRSSNGLENGSTATLGKLAVVHAGQRSMMAMFPSSWRSPGAGVRLFSRSVSSAQLDALGGGVLLDAGDSFGAANRGNVVTLHKQPGQSDLCRLCSHCAATD